MKNFYSYSKLSCYSACPLQYDLQYRQKIQMPRTYSFETTKGNIFHRYAENYRGDRREALDIALKATDEGVTQEFLDKMTPEQMQMAIDYTKMFDQLWETKLRNIPTKHELKLTYDEPYDSPNELFGFTGYIDNLLDHGGGSYTILDYKTAKSANPSLYKKQIILYAYFLSKIMNVPVTSIQGALFFPCAQDVDSFEQRWKPISITQKSVDKEVEWMYDTIKKIEVDPPNIDPALHFLCRWCSFAGDEKYCVTSVIAGLKKS